MTSIKEYSKLSIDDNESNSSTLEVSHDYLCRRCSDNIEGARGILRRSIFGRASIFQVCVCILLLTANLGTIAVWSRTNQTLTDCIRPVLTFSMIYWCSFLHTMFSKTNHIYYLDLPKADGVLSYEKAKLTTDIDANVYAGLPRPVHDEAWSRAVERKSSFHE